MPPKSSIPAIPSPLKQHSVIASTETFSFTKDPVVTTTTTPVVNGTAFSFGDQQKITPVENSTTAQKPFSFSMASTPSTITSATLSEIPEKTATNTFSFGTASAPATTSSLFNAPTPTKPNANSSFSLSTPNTIPSVETTNPPSSTNPTTQPPVNSAPTFSFGTPAGPGTSSLFSTPAPLVSSITPASPFIPFGTNNSVKPVDSSAPPTATTLAITSSAPSSGFGSSLNASTTVPGFSFGAPSSKAPSFGASTPTIPAPTQSGFGAAPSTGFSFTNATQAKPPATSLFGSSTPIENKASAPFSFGQPTTAEPSLFGQTALASTSGQTTTTTPLFGQAAATTPLFGQAPSSSFGQSSVNTFGASTQATPTFGSNPVQSAPSFGSTSSTFGQPPNQSVFGQAANQSTFGQAAPTSQSAFGQSTFGKPALPAFGQTPTLPTSNLFGQNPTQFGQQTNTATSQAPTAFGQQNTTPSFGQQPQNTFGQSSNTTLFGQPAPSNQNGFSFGSTAAPTPSFGQSQPTQFGQQSNQPGAFTFGSSAPSTNTNQSAQPFGFGAAQPPAQQGRFQFNSGAIQPPPASPSMLNMGANAGVSGRKVLNPKSRLKPRR